MHVPWCMPGSLTSGFLWSRWRGKCSRHSRRMRNPQFYVSGKRPMPSEGCLLTVGVICQWAGEPMPSEGCLLTVGVICQWAVEAIPSEGLPSDSQNYMGVVLLGFPISFQLSGQRWLQLPRPALLLGSPCQGNKRQTGSTGAYKDSLHVESETKWMLFDRWNIKMHFLEWKASYFD